MKGILPIIAIILVALLTVGAVGAAHVIVKNHESETVYVSTSSAAPPKAESIIPHEAMLSADTPTKESGTDFTIVCDKTVYTFYDTRNIYCNVTNKLNTRVSADMDLIFRPEVANIEKAYLWDENVEIPIIKYNAISNQYQYPVINNETGETTYEIRYYTTYEPYTVTEYGGYEETNKVGNSVKGLNFGKHETKYFRLTVKALRNTAGKFDIRVGETTLDPWWNAAYPERYQIFENTTADMPKAINDTDGLNGNITWARTWNESYAYSTGTLELGELGDLAIANETEQKYWEDEPTLTGNTPASVWGATNALAVFHMGNTTDCLEVDSTLNNTPTVCYSSFAQTGVFGYGELFDPNGAGSGNHPENITFPDSASLSPTKDLVIDVWIYSRMPSGTGFTNAPIVNKDISTGVRGYYLELMNDSATAKKVRFVINSGAGSMYIDSSSVIAPNSWAHIVAIYDASVPRMQIWVNGTNVTGTLTGSQTSINDNALPFVIGSYQAMTAGTSYGFNGTIDELRLYDNADIFTAARIRNEYYNYLGNLTSINVNVTATLNANYSISASDYDTYIYEVQSTNNSINITTGNAATVSGYINWNSTNYAVYASNTTPTEWQITKSIVPNFTVTNHSVANFYYNFTLTYPNGTVSYNQTIGLYSQRILWSYYWGTPTSNVSSPLMSEPIQLNSTLTKVNNNATVSNAILLFKNTSYMTTANGNEYYRNLNAPSLVGVINYNFTGTFVYSDRSITRNSATSSVTVTPINITSGSECSPGIPALRFDMWNEESPYQETREPLDITVNVWNSIYTEYAAYNISFLPNHTHTLCIYPNTTTAYSDIFATYSNGTIYPVRHYFTYAMPINNTTQTINLYSLNSTYASNVLFIVKDTTGIRQSGAVVKAQRYYPGENVYRYVDMGLTDSNGETMLKLRGIDVYHAMSVWYRNNLLETFERMIITSTEVILSIVTPDSYDYWEHYGQIDYSCTESNTTWTIYCEYETNDGSTQEMQLLVNEVGPTLVTEICKETDTGISGSLLCTVGDWTDTRIVYTLSVLGSHTVLLRGEIASPWATEFGLFGLFFFVMLLTGMIFAAATLGPAGAGIIGVIGIIAGISMKLLNMTGAGLTAILLVLIIVIVKYR